MGNKYEKISVEDREFILEQKVFFVATASYDGRVNVSPKGMDTLKVIGDNRIMWLNLTGSGNETAAHLLELNRMTLMFCAFEGKPLILRAYGTAKIMHEYDESWESSIKLFPKIAGARQIIDMDVSLVQRSCGMAVPYYDFKDERKDLKLWAEKQGEERLHKYWKVKNTTSIDGKNTRILADNI